MGRLTCPFSNSLIFLLCGEIKTRFTRHIEACGKEPMLLRGSKFYYSLPPKSVWGILLWCLQFVACGELSFAWICDFALLPSSKKSYGGDMQRIKKQTAPSFLTLNEMIISIHLLSLRQSKYMR